MTGIVCKNLNVLIIASSKKSESFLEIKKVIFIKITYCIIQNSLFNWNIVVTINNSKNSTWLAEFQNNLQHTAHAYGVLYPTVVHLNTDSTIWVGWTFWFLTIFFLLVITCPRAALFKHQSKLNVTVLCVALALLSPVWLMYVQPTWPERNNKKYFNYGLTRAHHCMCSHLVSVCWEPVGVSDWTVNSCRIHNEARDSSIMDFQWPQLS